MEGRIEGEIRNKDLMAPCGLYCGACGVYIATRDNNQKFKTIMGNLYGTTPEETECLGCMQPDNGCPLRLTIVAFVNNHPQTHTQETSWLSTLSSTVKA